MGTIRRYKQKGRDGSGERAESGEESATDHVGDPQRHHRLRQQGGDKEDRAHQGKHVGQGDIVQKDFQQPVEDGVIGDVVGVEAKLDQDLRDPEIVGRGIENAIQRLSQVCTVKLHHFPRRQIALGIQPKWNVSLASRYKVPGETRNLLQSIELLRTVFRIISERKRVAPLQQPGKALRQAPIGLPTGRYKIIKRPRIGILC